MAGIKEDKLPSTVGATVRRESSTEERKRMDLVIDHPRWSICIENKIDHWLANDLGIYATEIHSRSGGQKDITLKLVLGLTPIKGELPGGFTSHTYAGLWQVVRGRIGSHLAGADPRWITHLLDFMENTERLGPGPMELKDSDHFYLENHTAIAELVKDYQAFQTRFYNHLTRLQEQLRENHELRSYLRKNVWEAKERCVVFDIRLPGAKEASLDLYLYPRGWELQAFGRDNASHAAIIQVAGSLLPPTAQLTANNRHILGKWDINTSLGDLENAVLEWIRQLTRQAAGPQPAPGASPALG